VTFDTVEVLELLEFAEKGILVLLRHLWTELEQDWII
jgi:hypothetical protein